MAVIPPTLTLPLRLGEAQIGVVEIDLNISVDADANVVVEPKNLNQQMANSLREAANRLAPQYAFVQKWITGIGQTSVDQHDEDAPLEWPTTPGSAVLADRHHGAGPQVLVLCKWASGETGKSVWWGGHGDRAAQPGGGGGWSWNGGVTTVDLLQVLYVAP